MFNFFFSMIIENFPMIIEKKGLKNVIFSCIHYHFKMIVYSTLYTLTRVIKPKSMTRDFAQVIKKQL